MDRETSGRRGRRWRTAALVVALVASACTGDDDGDDAREDSVVVAPDAAGLVAGPAGGGRVALRLAQGEAVAPPEEPVPVVDGAPLPPDRVDAVVDRLPPFEVEEGDREAFNRPAETLPPPVAGATVATPFPPADGGDPAHEVPDGPLQVVRYQPEGDVDVAPSLSVTFNQAMVPLATLDQLDEEAVPAVVTPELPGRWRWIGTRTLRFEHTSDAIDRLPMATEYRVTVPAGTRSATGGELADDVSFAFATPAPVVRAFFPQSDSLVLEPVFVAVFDQRVDPAAVLEHVRLDAGGNRAVRLATAAEIAADDDAQPVVDAALDGRWVAFRPVEPLPADTPVTATFLEGTPSAEGPRTTSTDQAFRGRTFPPLSVVRTQCGHGGGCRPGAAWVVSFSNPLDTAAFDPASVTIEPSLPGASLGVTGAELFVSGASEARTTYRITLPAELRDERGQVLGAAATQEVEVGDPQPFLRQLDTPFVTVDPLAELPSVPLVSAGHDELRVVALRVEPDDWRPYLELDRYGEQVEVPDFPVLFDRVVDTRADDGAVAETILDLADAFPDGSGQALLYVEPMRTFPANSEEHWLNRPILTWVQATHVGIDALHDTDRLVVWTTDLRDGSPIVGAEVAYAGATATTDDDGLATFDLDGSGAAVITATAAGQTAVLGADYVELWTSQPQRDVARWYVFDDRGLYRPGETVRLKGWVRRLQLSGDADLALVDGGAQVRYRVVDGQYVEVATGEVALNALGAFDLAVDLPPGANLGAASVELALIGPAGLDGTTHAHPFSIEEFRRPEFEVDTREESPSPHVVTQPVTVAATAAYFAGGPLPNAPVTWTVSQRDTTYAPPGWEGFTFGVVVPWWLEDHGFEGDVGFASPDECCSPPGGEETVERLAGTTDASGTHYLEIDFGGDAPDQPILVTANAAVEDLNRQAFAATTDLLVHAGERYLGLRSDRAFVRRGDPLRIDAILTDIDGAAVAGERVTLTLERLVEELVDGEWAESAVDAQTCEVTTAAEPARCELTPDVGGRYRVSGTVRDAAGGANRTELELWVSGGDAVPSRRVEQEQLTLIPAEQDYQVGDTAEILVPAPFTPATGLVTITRNGIRSTEVLTVPEGTAVVEIPLHDAMVPGIDVRVDLVGAAPRVRDDGSRAPDLPDRPAYATGSVSIAVPPTSRTLAVAAVPRDDAVEPGADTAVDVTVTDAAGDPVAGADLAVVVVDEAVLSLIGYDLADPVETFYGQLATHLSSEHVRRTVLLTRDDALIGSATDRAQDSLDDAVDEEAAEATDGAAAEGLTSASADAAAAPPVPAAGTDFDARQAGVDGTAPIAERSDFDALAVFAPSVTTDAAGRATVGVELPDNLTRYRVLAVAASGAARFGKGEATLTARLPLQVRPSAPRFANFGDAFELPLVLHNQSADDLVTDVVLETANLEIAGAPDAERAGVRVTVPAGDRVEVRFPVTVADAGTARFRATAVSGDAADSASGSLPVFTPTTTESFATYGALDDGAVAQPLRTPEDVVPQFGGLEVTTSSTALQALTDAVLYLADYRYESSDALASRLLAIATLRDVLDAFDVEGLPPAGEIEQVVADDIDGLVGLQNDDGGWPVWERSRPSDPYHTIQATHALLTARDAGYDVPADVTDLALERLRTIDALFEQAWSEVTKATLRAYAVHVRALAGDRDPAAAAAIHASLVGAGDDGTLPLDALAWLWPVVDDPAISAEIEATFRNQVTETPSAATFTTGYGEDAHLVLGSDRRTDGIVLGAFLQVQPGDELVPKIVNGLIANQRQGRWDNVQENAFILLALKRYFDTFEADAPDFVARVWLGDLYAAEHPYRGRSVDSTLTVVTTADLLARDDPSIVLANDGDGRLYYRLGLRTAPADLRLDARDEGFVVQREYTAVGDPSDVVREADGTWRIRAGAEVRVSLTMVAESRRVNMALVDPLPAGLEVVNPALTAAPALPPSPPQEDGEILAPPHDLTWFGTWFDHQNLRDDRAEAFSALLAAGTYEWSYIARATTPGTFVVPPARAEEIYTPEVFGRTTTDVVVVVDG